jgi:U3 small nucleolar RNA-associated protein 3
MCKQLKQADDHMSVDIDSIVESIKNNRKIVQVDTVMAKSVRSKRMVKKGDALAKSRNRVHFDDEHVDEEELLGDNATEMHDEDQDLATSKRAINYKIEKNKGLTPHRNKLVRNPRVKHREKYRKALIKRKSIVPKVRYETKRYAGEASGIRAGVVRSVKLK